MIVGIGKKTIKMGMVVKFISTNEKKILDIIHRYRKKN